MILVVFAVVVDFFLLYVGRVWCLQLIHLSPDFIHKMKCQEQAHLAHRLMVVGKEHMKPFSTIQ